MIKKATHSFLTAILVLFFFNTSQLYGQNTNDLPHVIPPSPVAMQFQKYGDYPVGNNTGIPAINIPLYTIKEGDLNVPISLSYHASGTKPSDVNGFVGLGWVVDCGGTITRTIIDGADEYQNYPTPFYTQAQLDNMLPTQRDNILYDWEDSYDSEPDIFSYNFFGNSGKFVLKRDGNLTPMLLPYKPIKFSFNVTNLTTINSTDLNGFQYEFHATETPIYASGLVGPTRWDLKKLTSPVDNTNSVSFEYANTYSDFGMDVTSSFTFDDELIDNTQLFACGLTPLETMENFPPQWNHGSPAEDYTNGYYPSLVTFRNGAIHFIKNATTSMLDRIEIYNNSNQLLTTIKFIFATKTTNRILLKEVDFYDANNTKINSYNLNYFNETNGSVPDPYHAGVDWWGYWNSESPPLSNTYPPYALVPDWTVSGNIINSSYTYQTGVLTREPNEDAMKTFVLNEIIYPTGGKTVFDFEANRYQKGGTTTYLAGGLRVKSITNYSYAGATPEIKSYKYSGQLFEDGLGILDYYPGTEDDYVFSQKMFIVNAGDGGSVNNAGSWYTFRRRFYSSNPSFNFSPHGSPVVYSTVSEYFGDDQNNTGRIVYSYDQSTPGLEDITFNNATVWDLSSSTSPKFKHRAKFFKDWTSGNLISKQYDQFKNNTYNPVKLEVNDYDYLVADSDIIRGVYMDRFVSYVTDCSALSIWREPHGMDRALWGNGSELPASVYNYADYYVQGGETRLKTQTITEYSGDNNPALVTTKNYEYSNSIHDQPTAIVTTNSKGETIRTEMKYPHEFISTQPYTDMVNVEHIWAPVIEQLKYKVVGTTNNFLESTKHEYGFWGGTGWSTSSTNIIVPKIVETQNFKQSSYQPQVNFLAYDSKGNLQSAAKANHFTVNYLWDYNSSYPVAEIKNAPMSNIAYTSFEADGTGGWTIGSTQRDTVDGITGHNSYQLSNGNITKSGLSHLFYYLTYWSKDGNTPAASVTITNATNITMHQGSTVNGWTFYYGTLVSNSTLPLTLSATGNLLIDELRLYPVGAQMTTYTYTPLVGMTSQCDVNNRITYYEYDAFNRVIHIRDQDMNIIKTFDYKFQAATNQ